MKHPKRRLYKKNQMGFRLVLLFIVMNGVYAVSVLNNMEATRAVGILIMFTIVFFLLGFLVAVKVQTYSLPWSIAAVGLGVLQLLRVFMLPDGPAKGGGSLLILLGSGMVCLAAGLYSVMSTSLRKRTVRELERKNDRD